MNRGFTLHEILIVVALLAIISGGALTSVNIKGQIEKSRDAQRKTDIKKLNIAFEHYYNDHNCYPSQDEWNNASCGSVPAFFQSYLQNFPCDPERKPNISIRVLIKTVLLVAVLADNAKAIAY